jgi:excisionase family DNA binding protein
MAARDANDPMDRWWTIDETAEHFGVKRGTVQRWIREDDLKLYFPLQGGYIDRDEVKAVVRARIKRRRMSKDI